MDVNIDESFRQELSAVSSPGEIQSLVENPESLVSVNLVEICRAKLECIWKDIN